MNQKNLYIALLFGLMVLAFSCKNDKQSNLDPDDKVLATVGDKSLFVSDLSGYIESMAGEQDSTNNILKGLVNNWIKEQLMIREAVKHVDDDFNIEKLVEDYRASLLVYNYENQLVALSLDTMVTGTQIQNYYEAYKQQYILSEDIIKYDFAKFSSDFENLKEFKSAWKESDTGKIKMYCEQFAEFYSIGGKQWSILGDLKSLLPDNIIAKKDLTNKKSISKEVDGFQYFVKIHDYEAKNGTPPLDYIKGKIVNVLLNDRKQEILKQKRQQIFDIYANTNAVKTYIN